MAPKKNTKAAASSKTKPSTAKGSRKASAEVTGKTTANLPTSKQRCVVVGSSFLDYVGYCDRVPAAGETVHSSSFQKGFGGKGANQAFMVAILKGKFDVSMVTAVGADGDGEAYVNNLKAVGIDTQFVQQVKGDSTGLAMISVSTLTGQNQIVICPNATHKFTPDTVDWDSVFGKKDASHSSSSYSSPSALVVQNEIPIATTLRALKEASDRNMLTVFNPAPAPDTNQLKDIRPYLKYVDIFCPNESEAALIAGVDSVTPKNAQETCKKLLGFGVGAVVLTMGSNGYSIMTKNSFKHYKAFPVSKVVDTTGAGDCFVGTMVSSLLTSLTSNASGEKLPLEVLEIACDAASGAASLSVQKKGTQSSFPNAEAVKKAPSALKNN